MRTKRTNGNTNWGDLLTAYDGQTISYDNMGNPLSDGTWTYTWEHGRQLASMSGGGTTWTYTYNADGMRTKRTNGSTTYEYIYNGSQLTQMTMNENGTVRTLYFIYDASGPIAFNMASGGSNTTYYYVKNAQGDIIAIVNKAGEAVVTYSYDAWGNLLSIDGEYKNGLGIRNPLRYRGYVYDNETGLYYLQSRYYDPTIGRFLNADAFASTGQGILGNNMFAYCLNNPVCYEDTAGSAARICFSDNDRLEEAPWFDHSPGGGGTPRRNYISSSNYYGEVADKFYAVRLLRAGAEYLSTAAAGLRDAYMRGYNIQNNVLMQEARFTLDGGITAYRFLNDTGLVDAGITGGNVVQAVSEGKKAAAYLVLPIPTPIDEAFAIGHALKGLYHFVKCIWR